MSSKVLIAVLLLAVAVIGSEVEGSAGAMCVRDDFASKALSVRSASEHDVLAAADAGFALFGKIKAHYQPAHGSVEHSIVQVESWTIANSKCGEAECQAYFVTIDLKSAKATPRFLLEITQETSGFQLSRYEKVTAIDCQVSKWSLGSECSAKCGGGFSTKSRCVTVRPQYGGKACPVLRANLKCNTQPCPVDCQVSEWTPFSECSAKCAGGLKVRTRKIIVQPFAGGKACPAVSDSEVCNQQMCVVANTPQNCVSTAAANSISHSADLTDASVIAEAKAAFNLLRAAARDQPYQPATGDIATSILDVTTWAVPNSQPHIYVTLRLSLDGTSSSRVFVEVQKGINGAPDQLIRHEMVSKVDCRVSDWNKEFSACSKKCGGGVRSRWRCVTQLPKFGGSVCPSLYEVQMCNTKAC